MRKLIFPLMLIIAILLLYPHKSAAQNPAVRIVFFTSPGGSAQVGQDTAGYPIQIMGFNVSQQGKETDVVGYANRDPV